MKEALEALKRGLRLSLGRAIIRLVDDAGDVQRMQLDRLADETADDLEVFMQYGFTSKPLAGAEAVVASLGGVRSHGMVIAIADRRYRLKGLQDGEVALYDDLGQVVHLTRTGLKITSPLKVEIDAPEVNITANQAVINANTTEISGDLSISGDLAVTGQVTLGEGAVLAVKLADNSNATKVKAK